MTPEYRIKEKRTLSPANYTYYPVYSIEQYLHGGWYPVPESETTCFETAKKYFEIVKSGKDINVEYYYQDDNGEFHQEHT